MRYAYALLGVGFLVIIGVFFLVGREEAVAPTTNDTNTPEVGMEETAFALSSPVFENGARLPALYTCDGERFFKSPPLLISGVPEGTKSLVLTMEDPDVPKELLPSGVFDHWVLYAIPPETREIPEGAEGIGTNGANGRDSLSYAGPCPSPDYEPTEHRYIFRLYALSGTLNFIKAPTKDEVLVALEGMILAQTELTGTYKRAAQ
jgi:Raf kinase inhibitor-like YbhB/YbcL family protein